MVCLGGGGGGKLYYIWGRFGPWGGFEGNFSCFLPLDNFC